jgi:hypothetical protein
VDGDALHFRIESVAVGCTLTWGDGSPLAAGALLGAGESLLWCPPAGQSGTLDAFTVTAWDGSASSSPPVQVRAYVQTETPYVGTITGPGAAAVHVYDMDGGGDVSLADISVVFADGDTIDRIDLSGDGTMAGLGLVVTGADTAGTVNDYRTTPGDVAFLASTGQFANVSLAGNVTGWALNGVTLQDGVGSDVIAFAADVDGDGRSDDPTALFAADYVQGSVKVQGSWAGDVVIEGANPYDWSLKAIHVYGGSFGGDLRAPGKVGVVKSHGDYAHVVDVGPELRYFLLYGGDFSGQVSTTGPMYAFLVEDGDFLGSARLNVGGAVRKGDSSQGWGVAGEAIRYLVLRPGQIGVTGRFRAGARVSAPNGRINYASIPEHETDGEGQDFGIWADSYQYVRLGETYFGTPYRDGDFVVSVA